MIEIRRINSEQEMKQIYGIRKKVFLDEQGAPAEFEADAPDEGAVHVLALVDGIPAGCARMLLNGTEAKLSRVAVLVEMRKYGLGSGLCRLLLSIAGDLGVKRIHVNSQLPAVGFYRTMGFETVGEPLLEGGITHIPMEKSL